MTFMNSIGKKSNGLAILPTGASAGNTGELQFRELAANGINYVSVKAPDVLGSDSTYTLPDAYPVSSGQVLASTTAGIMSWVSQSSGGGVGNNYVINPEMNISQRGTTFTFSGVATGYTLDRWQYSSGVSGANMTISQSTTVPAVIDSNYLFTNSLLVTNNATATPASGQGVLVAHKIEGYNYKAIAQKQFTVSFWVRSSVTGTYSLGLQNSGVDRSYIATYTINSANTWEKKTITVAASPSAGTWDYINGVGIAMYFVLSSAGTVQNATLNTWLTGNFYSSTTQTNFNATNGATFYLTGVKVEPGSTASDFSPRNFATEVELCQRYYQKTFNLATTPASNTESSLRASGVATQAATGVSVFGGFSLVTRMRATPSFMTYNPFAAGSQIANNTSTSTGTSLFTSSPTSVSFVFTVPAGGGIGTNFGVHYTADSEL